MKNILILIFLSALVVGSFAYNFPWLVQKEEDLPSVDEVDIEKLEGLWYEIARLPFVEEKHCLCTQSVYEEIDGKFMANHTCHRNEIDADIDSALTEYRAIDETNAKFHVYKDGELILKEYIIALDEDYNWALMGNPSRDALWIVSREPLLDYDIVKKLVSTARELDFPVEKLIFATQICGDNFKSCLPTVDKIDLDKFMGLWYEIARLPFKEEKNCLCTQKDFFMKNNKILANTTCHRGRIDEELKSVVLEYDPLDSTNTKFQVSIGCLAGEESWVIDIDDDYEWVLLGDPSKELLWMYSREPILDYEVVKMLVNRAEELDFPIEKLIYTTQTCGNNYE